jgi:OmpA-OmpF porin, OOP family
MTRSEARTPGAWRAFDRAALFIALVGLSALLLLWWSGYRPSQTGCCAAPVIAAPATTRVPVSPPPAPPAAEPPKVEPARAEPPPVVATAPPASPAEVDTPKVAPAAATAAVDCSRIADGVMVHFAFASATLGAEARALLDRAALCVGSGRYEVIGHADSVGDKALNQTLSEARAEVVVAYLRGKGIDLSRLAARGYGETQPIADNATTEGRAQNRRAVLTRIP